MIFTAGHSTHDARTFAAICRGTGATPPTVIDVRSHPNSRHKQFCRVHMKTWLPVGEGLEYEWMPELGGWTMRHKSMAPRFARHGVDVLAYTRGAFPRQRIGVDRPEVKDLDYDERPNEWWNQGLYDYAWYATLPEWLQGCGKLIARYNRPGVHCVIFCSEARWDKCHRQVIADYLEGIRDVPVFHLKPFVPKRPTTQRYVRHRDAIRIDLDVRMQRYPKGVLEAWRPVWESWADDGVPRTPDYLADSFQDNPDLGAR